jgi:organic hydroperoxide reductase OsmC/OhrA
MKSVSGGFSGRTRPAFAVIAVAACWLVTLSSVAEVVRVDVERRSAVADGASYGLAGPYEARSE